MSIVRLRTALPADREAVTDLLQVLNVHEAAITGDRLVSREAAQASYRRLQERIAARSGRLVVAEVEGQPVGFLGFVVEEDEPHIRPDIRRYGFVIGLVVNAAWRRRGVGRLLLLEAERLTRERGLKRLSLGVLAGNAGARGLYETCGFGDYARILTKPLD